MKNSYQPLSTHVQYVKGVGPALADKLSKMGIYTVADLLSIVPNRYIDRRSINTISELIPGKGQSLCGQVIQSRISFMGKRRKRIYEVIVEDDTGRIALIFFYFNAKFYAKKYAIGTRLLAYGDVAPYINRLQIIHPEVDILDDTQEASSLSQITPVYPLTEGVHQKTMRKIVQNAWDNFNHNIVPIFPDSMMETYRLSDPWHCLQEIHFPSSDLDVDALEEARSLAYRTLIFDEFFFIELGLQLKKNNQIAKKGIPFSSAGSLVTDFLKTLPFELTDSQKKVISEINDDMSQPHPMNRLLQGDVGSGKTIVAIITALRAIEAGYQVAIMAPTEILAGQHYLSICELLSGVQCSCGLLTSGLKPKERDTILSDLRDNRLQLIVGTHALIQKDIDFHSLGMIIIDEQHRFGVEQRAILREKAVSTMNSAQPIWPDVLIMSATPIPRTLALTVYGDLHVSIIDQMPKGRKAIITRLYHEGQREKLYHGLQHELNAGRQAYIVYPLIEESDTMDLKNATDMCEALKKEFEPTFNVALLHGRMKSHEKDDIMGAYKGNQIHILVATSVVEVGVDVPNATVMVIEHAERFGLSQLHQLRGRVGRGVHQSYCVLMADYKRSEVAKERLEVMVESNDGFKIAEEDLRIRGPGDFLGTRQSGLPPFRLANLVRDAAILEESKIAAQELLVRDRLLNEEPHKRIKEVLISRWEGRLNYAEIS